MHTTPICGDSKTPSFGSGKRLKRNHNRPAALAVRLLLSGQTNFAELPPESIVGPAAGNSTNGTTTTATTTVSLALLPGLPQPPPITQTTFVWTGNGTFDTLSNWNPGAVPAAPVDTVIIQSGTVTYTNTGNITYSVLTVEPGATFIINPGSSLTVSTLNLEAGAQIENLGGSS